MRTDIENALTKADDLAKALNRAMETPEAEAEEGPQAEKIRQARDALAALQPKVFEVQQDLRAALKALSDP